MKLGNKVRKTGGFIKDKMYSCGVTLMSVWMMLSTTFVYADATDTVLETVIDLMCKLALAAAAVLVIVGGISYASAHAEGDGPAQNKAVDKIIAAIMLAIVSAFVLANKSTFVSIVSS